MEKIQFKPYRSDLHINNTGKRYSKLFHNPINRTSEVTQFVVHHIAYIE